MQALPVYLIHWNAPEWVAEACKSIQHSDIPVSLTVVDNGPRAATARLALPPNVRLLQSGGNLGFAGGANVALRDWLEGSCRWCLIGAHDLQTSPSDLRLMVEAGDRAPSFGILGPGTTTDYYAGHYLGWTAGIQERTVMNGTCLLLRRECILDVGLFDPQFGSYGEDDELCFRARSRGWKVGRVPGTGAHGLGSAADNRTALRMRNLVMLAIKTSGRRAGVRMLFGHARILGLATLRMWLPGSIGVEARRVAAARWYGLTRGLPLIWLPMDPPPRP
jgi:GT2 family glycosyltransferase